MMGDGNQGALGFYIFTFDVIKLFLEIAFPEQFLLLFCGKGSYSLSLRFTATNVWIFLN